MPRTELCARKGPSPPVHLAPKKSNTSRVTKAKRGRPRKGRPQKPQQPSFPFMKLPLELRRNIYNMVLPSQDVPIRSPEWANMIGTPNKFMNLLLVNRQISEEARSVLYGLNTFTITIVGGATFVEGSWNTLEPQSLETTPSLRYIKNWQLRFPLDIHPECGEENTQIRAAILSTCAELATIPDLQSLKILIPCLCEYAHRYRCSRCRNLKAGNGATCRCIDIEDIHEDIVYSLAPLNHLRFKHDVQFISMDWSSPRGNQQCQKSACLSFTASFNSFVTTLRGDSAPLQLTPSQSEWFRLKRHAAQIRIEENKLKMEDTLYDAWKALDSGSEEYMEITVRNAMTIATDFLRQEPSVASQIVRHIKRRSTRYVESRK